MRKKIKTELGVEESVDPATSQLFLPANPSSDENGRARDGSTSSAMSCLSGVSTKIQVRNYFDHRLPLFCYS